MKLLPLSLLMLVPAAMASSATQSDWSGGPGFLGPVSTWDSNFWLDTGTSWPEAPGSVGIFPTILDHLIGLFDWACCVDAADINNDGDLDVLASSTIDGVVWFENADGLGTSWTVYEISEPAITSVRSTQAVDLDSDGDIDVVGGASPIDAILWWENADEAGTIWVQHTIDAGNGGIWSIHCEDLDGDGDPDVLAAAIYAGEVKWWENYDGQGNVWIEHIIATGIDGAAFVHCDDIDGDGDEDVLGAAYLADEIIWWENLDGLGTSWAPNVIDAEFDGAWTVHSGDMDADGDIDVVASAFDARVVSWWENADGQGGGWTEHLIDGNCEAWSVYSGDMDGDGDLDVLEGNYTEGTVWWENADGLGTSWILHVIDLSLNAAGSLLLTDINEDSKVDAVVAYTYPSALVWWDLNSYPSEASLESSILYTGCDPDWGTLLWSSQIPPATFVSFQIRASDDYSQMGAWSDTLSAPCSLHGLLADNASYIQYRAILETTDPDTTPSLLDVTVTWDPLGTGGSGPSGTCLLPVAPNPSSSSPSIDFNLAEEEVTELSVYDLSGRLVREFGPAEYPAGAHTIQLQPLSPGIYFVRLRAGEFTATQRFAVVE